MGGHAARLEIAYGALHRLEMETGMLEVEQHEVAAGIFEDMADAGRGEFHDEMAEFGRTGPGHRPQAALAHRLTPCSIRRVSGGVS